MIKQDRRKFLVAGFSLTAIWAALHFWKKPLVEKPGPAKFLTQDGTLVAVDWERIPQKKTAASKTEIQQWIKKN